MSLGDRRRFRHRLHNAVHGVLLLAVVALAAWLGVQLRVTADWTDAARNTLTPTSRDIVERLERPVRITAFVADDPELRRRIEGLLARYRRAGARMELEFVNPELRPGLARELGIRGNGELIVRLGEASERLQHVSEESLSRALAQLGRDRTRWIVFVQGHGERDPLGDANFDLGTFGARLRERGYQLQTLELAVQPVIPDNTDLLVLASPRSDYLPGELARIRQYLERGHNLLWLTEPGADGHLGPLPADMGLQPLPGVVVDAGARLYGADSPDFAVAGDYPAHPVTEGFDRITLFPQARALRAGDGHGWSHRPLVRTREQSWTERGPLEAGERIRFDADAGEIAGPLRLAFAATRGGERAQRIAVVGDGDWLSNAYIGNGGNLALGMRLVAWLVGDDMRLAIEPRQPADLTVSLSRPLVIAIGFGFLLLLPAVLAGTGAFIWIRRRRR